MKPRTKQEVRDRAFAFKGNAWLQEVSLEPVGLRHLEHPNRVMERHRSSNKRRRSA